MKIKLGFILMQLLQNFKNYDAGNETTKTGGWTDYGGNE